MDMRRRMVRSQAYGSESPKSPTAGSLDVIARVVTRVKTHCHRYAAGESDHEPLQAAGAWVCHAAGQSGPARHLGCHAPGRFRRSCTSVAKGHAVCLNT